MAGLLEMMGRVSFIKENVEQIAEKSLNDISEVLVEKQLEQMKEGIDSKGEPIQWQHDSHYPYTLAYSKRKQRFGGQTQVVDLKGETGQYYRGMKAKASGGVLTIKSDDPKGEYIEENYDKDKINGLTDENVREVIEEDLTPVTLTNVKEILKL